MLPKILTTNLAAVDRHGSFTTSLALWGRLVVSVAEQIKEPVGTWFHRVVENEAFPFIEASSPRLTFHNFQPDRTVANLTGSVESLAEEFTGHASSPC